MTVALQPFATWASIKPRYGSHTLRLRALPAVVSTGPVGASTAMAGVERSVGSSPAVAGFESVGTSPTVAGFEGSVATLRAVAGFAGRRPASRP